MDQKVKDLLVNNGLEKYVDLFKENALDEIEIISGLSEADLEKIGIKVLGDRKKILMLFSNAKQNEQPNAKQDAQVKPDENYQKTAPEPASRNQDPQDSNVVKKWGAVSKRTKTIILGAAVIVLLGIALLLMLPSGSSNPSSSDSFESIEKKAKKGNAAAQNILGLKYCNGEGAAQNYNEAVKWFRLAADQGHAGGQNNLGWMYENGRGVAQNDNEAVKWYRLAADQGNAFGQNNLGNMYYYGRGVAKNHWEAVKWYRLAADQGLAEAQNNLAKIYDDLRSIREAAYYSDIAHFFN